MINIKGANKMKYLILVIALFSLLGCVSDDILYSDNATAENDMELTDFSSNIVMSGNDGEYIFEFRQNGLIFIRGEQVDDNKEVYRLFKEFIEGRRYCEEGNK